MPDDVRLYWLLGELLNADGDIESAKTVFGEFLKKFAQSPEFQFNPDPEKLFPKFLERFPEIGHRLKALREYEPPLPIPLAQVAKPPEAPPKSKQDPDQPAVSFQVDWQTLAVGFGAGGVVGFMISWRLRNALLLRRQRKRVAA